mgnify:CR=1 FL=1
MPCEIPSDIATHYPIYRSQLTSNRAKTGRTADLTFRQPNCPTRLGYDAGRFRQVCASDVSRVRPNTRTVFDRHDRAG